VIERCLIPAFLMLGAATASADQYWVEYDPTSGLFPEEVGWTRHTEYGGAERSFADGALVLDGLASTQIVDFYTMSRPSSVDPGPGELFVARWRLQVDDVVGLSDPGVGVYSDDSWFAGVSFATDQVMSLTEPGVTCAFTPGVHHEFELRSSDMRSYVFYVDHEIGFAGSFHHLITSSEVGWGDAAQGDASLSRWQSFGFGVIPEPSTVVLTGALGGVLVLIRVGQRST
jgi:hypothetical protein